jgi:NAD(P)H-dependent FMN reductase
MKILAFSGSNSASSINQELIKHTVNHLKIPADIVNLKDYNIPMYSIDEENENGFSSELKTLFETFKSYDAYVISIPEHNGNYPAFFKNIIDWFSRIERGFFKGKPVLLLSASPGKNGGASVLSIAEQSFPFLGGNIVGRFSLPEFQIYKQNGKINIENTRLDTEFKEVIYKYELSLNR